LKELVFILFFVFLLTYIMFVWSELLILIILFCFCFGLRVRTERLLYDEVTLEQWRKLSHNQDGYEGVPSTIQL